MRFGELIDFVFDLPAVWKLRATPVIRYGRPVMVLPEKLRRFEGTIARLARLQKVARGYVGQYSKADKDRVAVELVIAVSTRAGDTDNYIKSILDGLNKADLMSDDNLIDLIVARRVFVPKGQEEIKVRFAKIEDAGADLDFIYLKEESEPCQKNKKRSRSS